jgi:hypothetical protein
VNGRGEKGVGEVEGVGCMYESGLTSAIGAYSPAATTKLTSRDVCMIVGF